MKYLYKFSSVLMLLKHRYIKTLTLSSWKLSFATVNLSAPL